MTTYFKAGSLSNPDRCCNCECNFADHTNSVCPGQVWKDRNAALVPSKPKHVRIYFKNTPGGRNRLVAEGEVGSCGISRMDANDPRRTLAFYTVDKHGKEMYVSLELTEELVKHMTKTWQEIENNPTGWTNHNNL